MKPSVLIVTLVVAAVLVPVAIGLGDVLALAVAGLIPLIADWRNLK